MVDRHEKLTPAAVVDLDGTYLRGNSLKLYIVCGFRYNLGKMRLLSAFRIGSLVALRMARLISHRRMKFAVLSMLVKDRTFESDFSRKAHADIDIRVAKIIDDLRGSGYRILLATAAPDIYIPAIWDGDYIATRTSDNKEMTECRGEQKRLEVETWLKSNGCRLDTVISDHYDDAPLFMANSEGTNMLVKPDKASISFFRKFKPSHLLIID